MSKNKAVVFLIIVFVISGGAWWSLRPKSKSSGFDAKEISIKQADIPNVEIVTYEDAAGFWFRYPSILTVEEVEVDDSSIYSSLELVASDGKKLTLRIADTLFSDIEEWQENFEESNVISDVERVLWVDVPAVQFRFGTSKSLKTVAIEGGVMYAIENLADGGGFWDQAHETILNSFEFDEPIQEDNQETAESVVEDEDIVLVEEILE